MDELQLILDLVAAVLAAFVGGVVAQRLGQPVILGYLAGGVVIGPFSPGPMAGVHSVQVFAEIGVAFLMFALGAEFSLGELRRLGRVALALGPLQILGTMASDRSWRRPLGCPSSRGCSWAPCSPSPAQWSR